MTATGYESTFRLHTSDSLRAAALVLIPVVLLAAGSAAAAAMALVSGGTWLLRYYAASRTQDVMGQLVFIAAGAFSAFDVYQVIWWLDLAVHFVTTATVTLLLFDVATHRKILRPPSNSAEEHKIAGWLLVNGSLAAVLWEIGEWAGYFLISRSIGVGISDSITDLLAGMLGIVLAVCWIKRIRSFGRACESA